MNIAILGATGKTGTELVRQALAAGHRVTALARRPEALDLTHPDLTVVGGDATNSTDLAKALIGQDAVLSALGSTKGSDQLIATSTRALVDAAQETGVQRIVVLSSFLAAGNYAPGLTGRLFGRMLTGMVADKAAGEQALRGSDLDWTVVHATALDKAEPGRPVRVVPAAERVSMRNGIARADVAGFMLAELGAAAHHRGAVTITTK